MKSAMAPLVRSLTPRTSSLSSSDTVHSFHSLPYRRSKTHYIHEVGLSEGKARKSAKELAPRDGELPLPLFTELLRAFVLSGRIWVHAYLPIRKVNDRGACVDSGEETSFFPWSSAVRIDLGHSRPARGLRTRYKRRWEQRARPNVDPAATGHAWSRPCALRISRLIAREN